MSNDKFNDMESEEEFELSEREIEIQKRGKVWNQKMATTVKLFIAAVACAVISKQIPEISMNNEMLHYSVNLVKDVLMIGQGGFAIMGALNFAKAAHDPLTPGEAKEVEERNKKEYEEVSKGKIL